MNSFRARPEDLFEVLELVHAASADTANWQPVARAMQGLLPGSAFSMVFHTNGPGSDPVPYSAGWRDEYLASYKAYYHSVNPYPGLLKDSVEGSIVLASEAVCPAWQKRQEYFNDWARPAGNYTHGACMTLVKRDGFIARLSYDLPYEGRDGEGFAAQILAKLGPHIRNALRVNARLAKAEINNSVAGSVLERMSAAAWILSPDRKVLHVNQRARVLLESGQGMRMGAGNTFHLSGQQDDERLGMILMQLGSLSPKVPTSFRVAVGATRRRANVVPLRGTSGPAPGVPGPLAMLIIDIEEAGAPSRTLLASQFGLTKAETDIAVEIAQGHQLQQIAERRGVSIKTLRNQLSAILSKVGVRRQAELVAHVSRMMPHFDLA